MIKITTGDIISEGACWSYTRVKNMWGYEPRPITDIFDFDKTEVPDWDKIWVLCKFLPWSVVLRVMVRAHNHTGRYGHPSYRKKIPKMKQKLFESVAKFALDRYCTLRDLDYMCSSLKTKTNAPLYLKYFQQEIERDAASNG